MDDEQGSSSAGDAGGPVQREVNQVGGRLDSDQTSGSTRGGPGGQPGFASFAHRGTVWAPFDERTHLHPRARPRRKEPPLLLTLRFLDTSWQRARPSPGTGASGSPTGAAWGQLLGTSKCRHGLAAGRGGLRGGVERSACPRCGMGPSSGGCPGDEDQAAAVGQAHGDRFSGSVRDPRRPAHR